MLNFYFFSLFPFHYPPYTPNIHCPSQTSALGNPCYLVFQIQVHIIYIYIYPHTCMRAHSSHDCHMHKWACICKYTYAYRPPYMMRSLYIVPLFCSNEFYQTCLSASCFSSSVMPCQWPGRAPVYSPEWLLTAPHCEFPQSYLLSSFCFDPSMWTWMPLNVNFVAAARAFLKNDNRT